MSCNGPVLRIVAGRKEVQGSINANNVDLKTFSPKSDEL